TLARLAPPRVRCGRAPISGARPPPFNRPGGSRESRRWRHPASGPLPILGVTRLRRHGAIDAPVARGYTAPSPTHGHGLEIYRGFDERFYPGGIVDSHPEFGGAHLVARRATRFRPVPGADERRIRLGPRGVRLRHRPAEPDLGPGAAVHRRPGGPLRRRPRGAGRWSLLCRRPGVHG